VDAARAGELEAGLAVGGDADLVALRGEVHLEPHADAGVVLDDQDGPRSGDLGHGRGGRPYHDSASAAGLGARALGRGGPRGTTRVKALPLPGSLSTSTLPRWAR